MRIRRKRVGELTGAKRGGEIVDERGRGGKEGIEAVLNRAVRDRNRQVCLASSWFAARISERPSVTKSGAIAEPSMWRRNDD